MIPKPFDSRLFVEVSAAVAEAAISTGVAREGTMDNILRIREELRWWLKAILKKFKIKTTHYL